MADTHLSLRSERIVKFLLRTGTATFEEILAEAWISSAPSIRRDLARLENKGSYPADSRQGHSCRAAALRAHSSYDSSASLHANNATQEESGTIRPTAAELVHENETIGLTARELPLPTSAAVSAIAARRSKSLPMPSILAWNCAISQESNLHDGRRDSVGLVVFPLLAMRRWHFPRRCLYGQRFS